MSGLDGGDPQTPASGHPDGGVPQTPASGHPDGGVPQTPASGHPDGGVPQTPASGHPDGGVPQTPASGHPDGGVPQTPASGHPDGGVPQTPASGHPDGGDPQTPASGDRIDPRFEAAWRAWLDALAIDADAALAAAHVYRDLPPGARDALLDALEEDARALRIPRVAIYAPLLAAESEPARRARIEHALGNAVGEPAEHPRQEIRALRGIAQDRTRVLALVRPLYLRFVDVLFCRYSADDGFVWVKHDALLDQDSAPGDGDAIDGIALETTPLAPVVEELAHAVLAQRRRGLDLPRPLRWFSDLFDARVEVDAP